MILIGKLSKDYFSNDEKSDEGFEDKRYSDRRFRVNIFIWLNHDGLI